MICLQKNRGLFTEYENKTIPLQSYSTSNLIIMKKKNLFFVMSVLCVFMTSCEKTMLNDQLSPNEGEAKVVFHVTQFSQLPFTTSQTRNAPVLVEEACSRISFAIFDGSTKVKSVNQTIDNDDFGTFSLVLPKGDYQLVVIAHNGTASATISSPDKITFPNNKCTDTFYICQDFTVTGNSEFDLTLKRAVAMFRLMIEDPIPASVSRMKFYYTGGSSTFDATSGYGCVNSKQTEYREITDDMRESNSQFDLYTFPHANQDTLKMVVTAQTSTEATIKERTFAIVPVKVNCITQYSGTFFESTPTEGDLDLHFQVDTTWVQYSHRY